MKLLIIAMCLFCYVGHAVAAETVSRKVGCLERDEYEKYAQYAAANEFENLKELFYFVRGLQGCAIMRGGNTVKILERPEESGGPWIVDLSDNDRYVRLMYIEEGGVVDF